MDFSSLFCSICPSLQHIFTDFIVRTACISMHKWKSGGIKRWKACVGLLLRRIKEICCPVSSLSKILPKFPRVTDERKSLCYPDHLSTYGFFLNDELITKQWHSCFLPAPSHTKTGIFRLSLTLVLSAASAIVYFTGNLNLLIQQCDVLSHLLLPLKIQKPHWLEDGATCTKEAQHHPLSDCMGTWAWHRNSLRKH